MHNTQKTALEKELRKVSDTADNLMTRWAAVASDSNTGFLKEKLDKLAARRKDLEAGVSELAFAIEDLKRHALSHDTISKLLRNFSEVFGQMKPYQQKELVNRVLHKAVLGEKGIKIALHGKIPDAGLVLSDASELPGQVSNCERYSSIDPSVVRNMRNQVLLWDNVPVRYERGASGHLRIVLA